MSKYTPGPWVHFADDNIICANDGRLLIEWQPRSKTVSFAERDANGRLISAAPELLEALKLALEHLDTLYPTARGDDFLVDTCVAAIAKATGEAP